MAERVIIYLNGDESDAHWVISKPSENVITQQGHGSISDAALVLDGRRAVVVVPSDDILLTQVTVPTKNIAKARVAVPNILEEMMSEDVDDMHFALGSQQAENSYPVVAIARELLSKYQHQLAEAGINVEKIIPSILALPLSDNSWSVVREEEEVIVRKSEYSGFSSPAFNSTLFLKQALNEVEGDQPSLNVYHDDFAKPDDLDVEWLNEDDQPLIMLFAKGIEQDNVINLLQGDYKAIKMESLLWKQWGSTVALVAAVAMLWFVMTFVDVYNMRNENAALLAEIDNTYRQTFPGGKMVNPRVQMEQALKKIKKGDKQSDSFLPKLDKVSNALSSKELKEIDFKKKQLTLDVQVKDLRSLDDLKDKIASMGLEVEIKTAKSEKGLVNGSLRVQ